MAEMTPAVVDDGNAEVTSKGKERAKRPSGEYYSLDPAVRMKELQEDGRIGGQFGFLGGRPRKPRAAEKIAEYAQREAKKIEKVFDDAMDEEKPDKVRMTAAKHVLDVERKEASLQLDEERVLRDMPREQLEEELQLALSDPTIQAALTSPDESDESASA